jgi:hypothetical protein
VRLTGFAAEADLVGRRVRVRWRLEADGRADSVTGEPALVVLGAAHDFEYGAGPEPDAPLRPGAIVHDTAAFPPAASATVDVVEHRRPPAMTEGGALVLVDVLTVSRNDLPAPPGDPAVPALPADERTDSWTEVARRTRTTVVEPGGRIVAREDEILDVGAGTGLDPLVPRCYELRGDLPELAVPAAGATRPRAVATPTDLHRTGRQLYELLPGIWRRHDVPPAGTGPASGRIGAIPESRRDAGQLRRLVDLFGVAADHLRSRADGLVGLHDVDGVEPGLLPHLAHLVGWELSPDVSVPLQRHEVRYAPQLYRMTGTIPGVQLWAKRLTRWDVEVKEFAENVLFSNDPGGEDSPTRTGSFTLDTADAELVASLGTAHDEGDFTYDAGTGPDDRYSSNTIGIFATLDPTDRVADVAEKRDRLLAATDRYLPANLRALVVLPAEAGRTQAEQVLGLTTTTETDIGT